MTSKSSILTMLECIGSHIKTLGYFVRENTIQTAVSAIELEAEELCEALQKMEGNIVQCLATDVDLQSWQDEIRRFSVSMDRVATPASLRETFCKISDTLSRVDDAISYPSEEFLSLTHFLHRTPSFSQRSEHLQYPGTALPSSQDDIHPHVSR